MVNLFYLIFQLNLDAVWTVIFGVPASKPVSIVAKEKHTQLCPDAALVILTMIRTMLNQVIIIGASSMSNLQFSYKYQC